MLDAMIAHYTGGNKAKFATLLGVSAQTISAWGTRNTFDSELIYTKCIDLSPEWLLTGEGPMLRDSKNPEENKLGVTPNATPISVQSDAVTLRLMDKLDEKDNIIKEKENKIDLLQSELRQKSEELATLKALHPQSQDKEPDPHSKMNEALEAFTDKPSGDYGEGYSPTKPPTTSKRSSAAKM